MPGSFSHRINRLIDAVGDGDLVMGGIVGQPYAAAEHVRKHYAHPRGGMSDYMEKPFLVEHPQMIQHLANNAVTPNGSNLASAAREIAERFSDMVNNYAPVEFHVLRNSTSYYVDDNGVRVYFVNQRAERNMDKE